MVNFHYAYIQWTLTSCLQNIPILTKYTEESQLLQYARPRQKITIHDFTPIFKNSNHESRNLICKSQIVILNSAIKNGYPTCHPVLWQAQKTS